MTAIGYTANHPLHWIAHMIDDGERMKRRALQVCERAAKKAINAILTECLRHLLTRSSENVLITLWECETALGKLIHEQNMLEAVDYYAEINDTIERMLDRLVRLEAEGRVKFTMVEAVGDAAD
jgi:hypothetical protein